MGPSPVVRKDTVVPVSECSVVVATLATLSFAATGAPQTAAPSLLEGGTVFLQNDLQAQRDAMRVFREFRRDMDDVEPLQVVESEADARFIALLTTSSNFVQDRSLIDTGGLIQRLAAGTAMYLVIYERSSNEIVWFDAVAWETRTNTGRPKSTAQLVRRLRAALQAGED